MKRKMLSFLVTAILLSLLCAPTAYADPEEKDSTERGNEQITIPEEEIPLLEFPSAEIMPQVSADQQGGTILLVSHEQVVEAVVSVTSGDAVRIAVTGGRVLQRAGSRVRTVLSKASLMEVEAQTDAELEAASDLGSMVFSNASIPSVVEGAAGDEIELVMTQKKLLNDARDSQEAGVLLEELLNSGKGLTEAQVQDSPVTEVELISNGQKITQWDGGAVLLSLPVDAGSFEAGKCYPVLQFNEDMSKTEHTGLCVAADDNSLWVKTRITHPGVFAVLAEETAETIENELVPMAASPLTSRTESNASGGIYVYLGAAVILAAAAAAGAAIVLKRRKRF